MIRFFILSFFLINLSFAFLLVSWVILDFIGVIDVIQPTQIDTSSLLMSLSLRVPLSSPLKRILMFWMSYMSSCLTTSKFPFSTYECCNSTTSSLYSSSCPPTRPLTDSSSMPLSSPAPILQRPDDLRISIQKGTHSTCNPHPIYNFLSYHHLSLTYFSFVSTLSSISIPTSTSEAFSHSGWKLAMVEEMDALCSSGTWKLVTLPLGKSPIGCRWVYIVNVGLDG